MPKLTESSSYGAPDVWRAFFTARVRDRWIIATCLVSAAVVHGRALLGYFGPDDLRHLEQAAGILPGPRTILRLLSQAVYCKLMLRAFGPNPLAFHAASFALYLVSIGCVVWFARRLGMSARSAALGGILFGCAPLMHSILRQADTINDMFALTCALLALRAFTKGSVGSSFGAIALFVLAALFKESVVALPLLAYLVPRDAISASRAGRWPWGGPLFCTTLLVTSLVWLRIEGRGPGGEAYALGGVGVVARNLATYTAWVSDLGNPLPDLSTPPLSRLVSASVLLVAGLLLAAVLDRSRRRLILFGLLWWLAGLLPVLPLAKHTYAHYTYVALPGLAIAVASALEGISMWAVARAAAGPLPTGAVSAARRLSATTFIFIAIAMSYAARADVLVGERLEARVPGTPMALDPDTRKEEIARRAVTSFGATLPPTARRALIIAPQGGAPVFGARSGREFPAALRGQAAYDIVQAVLDDGRALQLFYPQLDSVRWVDRWDPRFETWDLFLRTRDGRLRGVGRGPDAQRAIAEELIDDHADRAARDYLAIAVSNHPDDQRLRWLYGLALVRTGARDSAFAELRAIIRIAPGTGLAEQARGVLRQAAGR